jgi:hypothetical protein
MSETDPYRENILYGLACGFCTALRLGLNDAQLCALISGKDGLGANDYCDANVLMAAAWDAVMLQKIFDPDNAQDAALWNDAWNLAVRQRYDMSKYRLEQALKTPEQPAEAPDAAAEFAIAKGLYDYFANKQSYDISEIYNGADEFMRRCAHLGRLFEAWSCDHVDFNAMQDVWPYYLEDHVGPAVESMFWEQNCEIPVRWGEDELLSLATKLRLPVRIQNTPNCSMNVEWAAAPAQQGRYQRYQVRTVRHSEDGWAMEHYTVEDAQERHAADNDHPVLFALYGSLESSGEWEFICEAPSYDVLRTSMLRMLGPENIEGLLECPVMQYPNKV